MWFEKYFLFSGRSLLVSYSKVLLKLAQAICMATGSDAIWNMKTAIRLHAVSNDNIADSSECRQRRTISLLSYAMNETNKKSCVSLRRNSFNRSVSLIYFLVRNTDFYRMAFMRPISAWKFVSKTYKIVRQFFKVRWLPLSMKTVQLARSWWQSRPKTVTMANRGKSFMIYWRVTFLTHFFRGIFPFAETIEIDFYFPDIQIQWTTFCWMRERVNCIRRDHWTVKRCRMPPVWLCSPFG